MLSLPKVTITRDLNAEESLYKKSQKWLEAGNKERDPRIHASDLLDPRKAYWNRFNKETFTRKMVGNFFVGKVLHAFFTTAIRGKTGTSIKETDVGGTFDKSLGITYSNDFDDKTGKIPGELKTSRAMNEQTNHDLSLYREQLHIYMAAKKSLVGRLVVLRLNAKDTEKGYGTYPQYRAYEITWTPKDLQSFRTQIKKTATLLANAIKKKKPNVLPVCRPFKCGDGNCGHWSLCRPEGRYGVKKWST